MIAPMPVVVYEPPRLEGGRAESVRGPRRAGSYVASLIAATLLCAAGTALAQVSPAIAECAAIAADGERLACYDRASGRAPTGAPAPAAAPASASTAAPALGPGPAPPATAAPAPASTSVSASGSMPGPGAAPAPTPAPVAAAGASRAPASLFDGAWRFSPDSDRYVIDLYEQNYVLFGRYTSRLNTAPFAPLFEAAGKPDSLESTEAKFQISFKMRLWTTDDRRWGVWAAYTQQSQWQLFNGDTSRPFRETNYMPELLVSYRPGLDLGSGFRWNLLNLSYNHQSNGRSDLLSRNWDRIIATIGVERSDLALLAKLWYPFNYKEDNPGITDYYGYGSLTAIYKWRGHSFSLMGRGNVGQGKGAAEATWMSPPLLGPLRAYVQAFSGYGESLIDYNWNQTTIGFGVALNDAL